MESIIKQLPQRAKEIEKENDRFFRRLKNKPPKNLDTIVGQIHDAQFKKTNCLDCANCCKTAGPLFTQQDITRISKHLKLKPQQFISQYLHLDEDNDYVLQQLPCVFLGSDNYCSIYDVRPKACREYPHTNRKKIYQISKITQINVSICPAAFEIVEQMKKQIRV